MDVVEGEIQEQDVVLRVIFLWTIAYVREKVATLHAALW